MERGEPPGWQEQSDAQSTDMTWEGAPIVSLAHELPKAVPKKENPKATRRTISFPGQLAERRSPFARYVEDRCHDIEATVRAFPGLNAMLSHSITSVKSGGGPRVKTDFTVTFEPRYREESRVQEALLDIIIDDAMEALAKSYRGEYVRAFEKAASALAQPEHPLIGYERPETDAMTATGAVELNHATPDRDVERREDNGGSVGAEITQA